MSCCTSWKTGLGLISYEDSRVVVSARAKLLFQEKKLHLVLLGVLLNAARFI